MQYCFVSTFFQTSIVQIVGRVDDEKLIAEAAAKIRGMVERELREANEQVGCVILISFI
jgi:hypothetical protein